MKEVGLTGSLAPKSNSAQGLHQPWTGSGWEKIAKTRLCNINLCFKPAQFGVNPVATIRVGSVQLFLLMINNLNFTPFTDFGVQITRQREVCVPRARCCEHWWSGVLFALWRETSLVFACVILN